MADELDKPIRKKFPKRHVYASGVDANWAADLVEMQAFARQNKGYKYILMIIDIFSKYGWASPLKNKTGVEVARAFQQLWKTQTPPKKLRTDKGKEFYNKHMNELLRKHGVDLYSIENEEKSCVVERWNRTIKRNMWKYFTTNNTTNYIDTIPSLIEKYNNTYHHTIKCTPSFARAPSSYQHVYDALYNRGGEKRKGATGKTKPTFKVRDRVRILKKKKTFEKGFTPNWTEELFIVSAVIPTKPITYKIKDLKGEEFKGSFYHQELQKTKQEVFRIEKVLKKRTRNGTKEVYVKWKGYNNNFTSWIPESNIH